MTPARLAELQQINTVVNSQIRPQADAPGLLGDRWQINVSRGDCDDYAVTKRARLLAAGWNSRSLLLAAAVLPDGQDHLVLVVRTTSGDIVLDNMAKTPKPVASVGYRWTALQDEMNPLYWRRIDPRRPLLAVAPLPPMQPNVRVATATAPFDVAAAPVALRGTIIR